MTAGGLRRNIDRCGWCLIDGQEIAYLQEVLRSEQERATRSSICMVAEQKEMGKQFTVRAMTLDDYEGLYALWMTIKGFGMRSIDDSRAGVERFLQRNPKTSVVAVGPDGAIVGGILCGHDGRRGCLYHVCVREDYRRNGIGKAMVVHCMNALRQEEINKVSLIAFTVNDVGNAFWNRIGWTKREDLNYYDFTLNEANITAFNR